MPAARFHSLVGRLVHSDRSVELTALMSRCGSPRPWSWSCTGWRRPNPCLPVSHRGDVLLQSDNLSHGALCEAVCARQHRSWEQGSAGFESRLQSLGLGVPGEAVSPLRGSASCVQHEEKASLAGLCVPQHNGTELPAPSVRTGTRGWHCGVGIRAAVVEHSAHSRISGSDVSAPVGP